MTLNLPRDYRATNQFFHLKRAVGEANAIIIVDSLWVQLGYQLEIHGISGFFQASDMAAFMENTPVQCPNIMERLVESGWLSRRGENYECPLFFYYNPELDKDYIPKFASARYIQFSRNEPVIRRESNTLVAELPQELWEGFDRTRILPAEMNEAIVLIKTVDGILSLGKRQLKEYTLPLIHAALRVVQVYGGSKLKVIMRRLFVRRSDQGLPRNTTQLLDKFDDMVVSIMPDEGYVKWAKAEGNKKI